MADWVTGLSVGGTALLLVLLAVLTLKGYGVARIGWLNLSRLKRLRERMDASTDTAEKTALEAVLNRCDTLRARWVLDESELRVWDHTRALLESVAAPFHPKSHSPLREARLGRLLDAFLEIRDQAESLARQRGVRPLTRFRLRHLRSFLRVWKQKTRWDESKVGRAARRFRFFSITRWAVMAARLLDLAYWSVKLGFYFVYDIAFRVLLLRWYLSVGELAVQVYRDRDPDATAPDEDVLKDLDDLPEPEPVAESVLPPDMKELVRASRKQILFHTRPLKWSETRAVYQQMAADIARHHHPHSDDPLWEASPYDLLLGLARFAEQVAALREQPVLSKLLDLRLSHMLRMKDTSDWILESQIFNLLRKYKVGTAVKYSTLIYKAFRRGHPGILFRDFAFTIAQEGLKRWLMVYLHGKLAVQVHWIYRNRAAAPAASSPFQTEEPAHATSSR
ncbi:hypothetical protein NITGR_20015 [Nitrospina gracilis 3/211]|uniref:Uncharacterized protein n=1 Tax=Nitrospina gracilis (strain 3/211) TaxID=1266370 RepID=M1YHL7_NITG3|nr:hypothetical protein [Nitrospina sp. Nb-3]MCF8722367.1 hypothetical protein [Nitrospina sp. Nb-3]CCQ89980.1 hypothetical protein NITGR_20015 [Nitrospina gracilis 3/211]